MQGQSRAEGRFDTPDARKYGLATGRVRLNGTVHRRPWSTGSITGRQADQGAVIRVRQDHLKASA